jgi:hypothetical protein
MNKSYSKKAPSDLIQVIYEINPENGWVITGFGIGATIAVFLANTIDNSKTKQYC